jgi:D-alanyl-D-alanine carboxypeptidase/D-alanyl-D-alanine-endopeptidase (penicillin-binding protein 4)
MRSAPWRLLWIFAGGACARGAVAPMPLVDDRAALRHSIDSMLAAPDTRSARWGVLIVDPERGDTLYSHDAGKLLVPASNQKILTAAVALDALGPEYRYETPFITEGIIRGGVLEGNLLIQGQGDPTVSDHIAGDAMLPLQAVADSIAARGITRIRGRLLPVGNAFPDANIGHAWEHDDLATSSGAAIDELLFNEGIAQVIVMAGMSAGDTVTARTSPARSFPRLRVVATTTDSAGPDSVARVSAVKDTLLGDVVVSGTIPQGDSTSITVAFRDPSTAYVAALREALSDRGVVVEDSSVVTNASRRDTLFVMRSPPLSEILSAFLKPSQNQIGEVLFKTVALVQTDTGTARVARRLFSERLRAWGAADGGFLVWDGSGLSRQDLVSPETLIRVLDTMRRHQHFQTYYDAFPVAGVDGTLRTRMRGTAAEANARGKTGTLSNVRSLSGYVTTADGRLLLYSVLCNNYLVPTAYVSRVQDTIAVRLARLRELRAFRGGVN